MKKLITLILLLVGGVSIANAAWYVVGDMTAWTPTPSSSITPMTESSGTFVSEFVISGNKNFCLADGDGSNWEDFHANHRYSYSTTGTVVSVDTDYELTLGGDRVMNFTGDGSTYRFTFVESTKTLTITKVDATISSIVIAGEKINDWDWDGTKKIELARVGETNVYTADFPCTGETGFGFKVNNIWMGYNEVGAENITAPTGWITNAEDNFVLKHNLPTYYDTYTVTATWTPNSNPISGWAIEIAGKTKDLKLQFASSEADWTKEGAWVAVWAWKNGQSGNWYSIGAPTDGVYTVSVPSNVDYWKLVRGYDGTPDWEKVWNQSAQITYKSGDDFISTFTAVAEGHVPTSTVIFNAVSIIGELTGDGTYTLGQEVNMTQDSEDPNKYTLVVDRDITGAKAYTYKLITNHKEDVYTLPDEGTNSYTINEAGKFQLTFSADVSTHTLSLEAKKYVSVGATGYSTFSSKHSLDFTGLDINAYRAEINASKQVVLKQVNRIPSNNGVMLKGTADTEVLVPIADVGEGDFGGGVTNCFVATDGTAEIAASTAGSYNYVFATSPALGFYNLAAALPAANVKVGGAYLHTDTELATENPSSSRVSWIFDGEATAINAIENAENTAAKVVYNLNGQRVMNPGKGLYIVNGKKVIIK